MHVKDTTALVTGGAAGIGLAITRALVGAGAHVIVVGRNENRLDRVRSELGNVITLTADLSDRAERDRVIGDVTSNARPLDILVNNAGSMQYFAFADERALARLDGELALDLHAPLQLCTALLPHLLTRPAAAVVNVTTGLVYAPFGNTPGYSAAKAGLHAFTQSLRWQTRHSSVHVLEVFPPAVDTDMTRNYDGPKTDSTKVAKTLMRGLKNDADEVRPGQTAALYVVSRIAPHLVFRTLNTQADKTPLDGTKES